MESNNMALLKDLKGILGGGSGSSALMISQYTKNK
jgi:hypothetical protein